MPEFTVKEIVGQREWAPADDPSRKTIFWTFKAEGEPKPCSIGRKPGNELKVGEVIDATATDDGRGGLKLKRNQQGGFGGGGYKPDPAKDRRITRQHSQDMGIETLKLAVQLGAVDKLPEIKGVSDIVGIVKTLAAIYDKDAYAAGEQS